MSNEDMSDIMQKLSSIINSSNTDYNNKSTNDDVSSNSNQFNMDNLKEFINNFQSSSQESNANINDDSNNSNNFNFDINTMMKMKNIMDKMNSSRNDPRSNLLQSLKPYLNNNRKERLDQYMQFLNISKVLEAFNSEGGVNSK